MSDGQTPFVDHAAPILAGDPAINDQQRSDLWDAFHSKDPNELVKHLSGEQYNAVPNEFKQRLFEAKQKAMPAMAPADKVTEAIQRIVKMDPQARELAETHPNLLKTFVGASTDAEKKAQEAAGESKPASKGKEAGKTAKPKALAQPPRGDGLEHYQPIPDGHRRIRSSDGFHYDVPEENLEAARQQDPNLMVLNP
jgi:hypothetical protein